MNGNGDRREMRVNLGAVRARAMRFADLARQVQDDVTALAAELESARAAVDEAGLRDAQTALRLQALESAARDALWRMEWQRGRGVIAPDPVSQEEERLATTLGEPSRPLVKAAAWMMLVAALLMPGVALAAGRFHSSARMSTFSGVPAGSTLYVTPNGGAILTTPVWRQYNVTFRGVPGPPRVICNKPLPDFDLGPGAVIVPTPANMPVGYRCLEIQ